MDNIIDTFNINKETINNKQILKLSIETDNDEELDIILKKKKLIEMCYNLTNIEYNEILNIIDNDNCTYSSNSNGVFVNLSNIEDFTINKIYSFLKFTKQKKEELKEKESYLENFKKTINKPENISIKKTIKIEKNTEDNYIEILTDNYDEINYDDYLCFSSDDENILKNKKK